jgi:hypothetical protein
MYPLSKSSRIINNDERLAALREGGVVYVDGKPVKRDPLRYRIVGNVQPLGGKDLLLVPEGDRTKEQYNIWSENRDLAMVTGDLVLRLGVVFQVQGTEPWGSYTKARMMAVDLGPDKAALFDTTGVEKWSLAPSQ